MLSPKLSSTFLSVYALSHDWARYGTAWVLDVLAHENIDKVISP